jgi:hypothetical protein
MRLTQLLIGSRLRPSVTLNSTFMNLAHLTDPELVRMIDALASPDDLPVELALRLNRSMERQRLLSPIEVHLDRIGMSPNEAASLLKLLDKNGICDVGDLEMRLAAA